MFEKKVHIYSLKPVIKIFLDRCMLSAISLWSTKQSRRTLISIHIAAASFICRCCCICVLIRMNRIFHDSCKHERKETSREISGKNHTDEFICQEYICSSFSIAICVQMSLKTTTKSIQKSMLHGRYEQDVSICPF